MTENGKGDAAENKEVKIEDVFEDIGGFGRFQKILSFATLFPQFAVAMITLSPIFTGSNNVPLYCKNKTEFLEINSCGINCTGHVGDVVFSSMVQEWDLVCSKSWISDAFSSCQMAGTMTGALISSLIADQYGRKAAYYFIALGTGFGGVLPALTISPITCAFARFIAGVGNGGCFVVFLVHLMEFLTPSWRTICGCVAFFPVGEMFLGLVAYHIPSWRYLTAVSALPVFLVFLIYPFIVESPRWLLTQKKTKEAHEILTKVAKWNSRPPPPIQTVEALQAIVLREEADVLKGFEGILQIIRNNKLRIDLFILTWATVTCSVVYYGVSFSAKSLSGSPYWNMFYMGMLDFMGNTTALIFNNRLGRKKLYLIFMTLASFFLVSILVMEVILGNAVDYPHVITIFALSGRYGIVVAWSALNCSIMETFPTTLRSTCMGFTSFAGYMGGVVAPQAVFLGSISKSIPYILYCTLAVSSLVSSLFLQEMAGVPLKDTANP